MVNRVSHTPPSEEIINKIKSNLVPSSYKAIWDWKKYPWHTTTRGIDTWQPNSSQALAIDLFGTLAVSEKLDIVMNDFAQKHGLPLGGHWTINLEWKDPQNLLNEKRQSQIDALASNDKTLIFFDCKFTESDAGACSQPELPSAGPIKGLKKCDGKYMIPTELGNRNIARCALSGIGIRYWCIIPEVFYYNQALDYDPCPFKGPWFQWMRNVVGCYERARVQGLRPAFFVIYADSELFPMPKKLKGKEWKGFTSKVRDEKITVGARSYQQLVSDALAATDEDPVYKELKRWVHDVKIGKVEADLRKKRGQ